MKQEEQETDKAKEFFESLGIQCYDIIPPIDSDIYCVKNTNCQWTTFKIGNKNPIVPFGRYVHMWGYDNGYCLVSIADKDKITFANRGIIDTQGNEVIKPYTYLDIFSFYGKKSSYVLVLTKEGTPIKIPFTLLKLL